MAKLQLFSNCFHILFCISKFSTTIMKNSSLCTTVKEISTFYFEVAKLRLFSNCFHILSCVPKFSTAILKNESLCKTVTEIQTTMCLNNSFGPSHSFVLTCAKFSVFLQPLYNFEPWTQNLSGTAPSRGQRMKSLNCSHTPVQIKQENHRWQRNRERCGSRLTVKLLLTFLVLDSATLASVRSTSSNMIDWKNTGATVRGGESMPGPGLPTALPRPQPSVWELHGPRVTSPDPLLTACRAHGEAQDLF